MTELHNKHRTFRLTRYFAVLGLASIAVAALVLGQLYQHFARQQLVESEERHHAELTQYFADIIWPRFGNYLGSLQGRDGDEIRANLLHQRLHDLVLETLRDSRLLKVKIFNTDGLTLYSSDPAQVGADKTGYPGFEAAKQGRVTSHLSFRDSFFDHADETRLRDRELLSSYVPVYGTDRQPTAVLELYSDVTPLLAAIAQTRLQLTIATIAVMLLLYSVLFVIIRRADSIIREQSSDQLRNELKIQHQANHDALTGLPNRRYFRDLLDRAMQQARKSHHLIAVLFIDLDRFKPINDSLGHQVGDELLQILAKRLSEGLRDSDILSRVGGDEFTVILDRLDNVLHIEHAAQRILGLIAEPFHLKGKELAVGASIGIAIYPFDDHDIDALIKHADTAMYHAKESGRNCFRFFSAEMNAKAQYRLALERGLQDALREHQLEIHYQPRLDLRSNRITGVEALARWRHPQLGMVSPVEFIPVAEDSGLINAIGQWVLKTACEDMLSLDSAGVTPLGLSVNVSARQFENPAFVDEVGKLLQATGLSAERLELELTESILMRSCEECSGFIQRLKSLGIRLALDDFGTGYSSLNYLKRLPLDTLKIDRAFIRDVHSNSRDAALAFAIAGLANQLDMAVVAEGIETEEQLGFVRSSLCQEAQGYLISPPLPLDELRAFLSERTDRAARA